MVFTGLKRSVTFTAFASFISATCAYGQNSADKAKKLEESSTLAAPNAENAQNAETSAAPAIVVDESEDIDPIWKGKFGPFKIGVMVGAEFPTLIHYSVESRFLRYFGASAGFGWYKREGSLSFGTNHWDVRFRYFPFSGSLFAGLGIGKQKYTGEVTESLVLATTASDAVFKSELNRVNITPMVGWHWIWDSGFNANFSLGYQMALSNSSSLDVKNKDGTSVIDEAKKNSPSYKDAKKKATELLDKFGGQPLPHFGLGIGWMI
jgi:hypothetical protein